MKLKLEHYWVNVLLMANLSMMVVALEVNIANDNFKNPFSNLTTSQKLARLREFGL